MHDARVASAFLRIIARGVDGQCSFAADDEDILDLLAAVSTRYGTPAPADVPRWVEDAVSRIRDEWRPELTVMDIARSAGVHPVYFARCVRRWYGIGASDLLRRSRLRHAARHIADGAPTIAQVAHATGFADESHLSREFSRTAGIPPARFRRLARAFGSSHNGRHS
jgi:AraC family transcriptional regulator